ncbi:MAG: putative phage terminase-like protein, partial [Caulobacteraceae bacterium]|nr:putative phage terminase-like protein [Caulobacteraceae bacterium]
GMSLIQTLRAHSRPVIPCRPKGEKLVRLAAASSYFEGGNVFVAKDAAWLADFEAEVLTFPGSRHDDQVDSVSQYFTWVRERPRAQFHFDPMLDDDDSGMPHEWLAEHILSRRRF